MEPRETSGATVSLLLRHVHRQGGDDAVTRALDLADIDLGAVDLAHWVSRATALRLLAAMRTVLEDDDSPFRAGASVLSLGANHPLVLVLRAFGSPRNIYRRAAWAGSKFGSLVDIDVPELGHTHATVRYRVQDGHPPSRDECAFARGLLSAVPELFALPAATVRETACQSDGAPACTYDVTWTSRTGARRRRGDRTATREGDAATGPAVDDATDATGPGTGPDTGPNGVGPADLDDGHAPQPLDADAADRAVQNQLEALQSASADLADSESLDDALARITRRAATAVLAPAYLLAVTDPRGGPPLVHSAGVPADQVQDLADTLLRTGTLPGALVVDVATARRTHGRLAALLPPRKQAVEAERTLLTAYARHAAAALDLLLALESSRAETRRATALLHLAQDLSVAGGTERLAEIVADAVPDVLGSDSASLMVWDPGAGELRILATHGYSSQAAAALRQQPIRALDTPELGALLVDHRTLDVRADNASPYLLRLLDATGRTRILVAPLVAGGRFLGVVTAGWDDTTDGPGDPETTDALEGIAGQASTALMNTELISTVRHQSLHDALTGLPNRAMFTEQLDEAMRRAGNGRSVGVLFCDLDKFKLVNEEIGHAGGDELLRQVAGRLRSVLRPTDTVARLSADEFAVLLPSIPDEDAAIALARRLTSCFAEPFRIDGRDVRVTAAVGVAVHEGGDGRGEHVLRDADAAMHTAKSRGRNQIVTATAHRDRPAGPQQPSMEAELATAIRTGQLRLFFQPVVSAHRGSTHDSTHRYVIQHADEPRRSSVVTVVGAEALVRWQHPRLGLLAPDAFLALAEESGLVPELDLWAVAAACRALAGWEDGERGPLHVSVNLAAPTLLDPRLPGVVRGSMSEHGIAPHRLRLEVVESRTLNNLPRVVEHLVELRQLGPRVSLDDFGTGYSTLAWLRELPVDQIKIDRSFVADVAQDGASVAVVRGVLALARELNLEVVAEGVEDDKQLGVLLDAGIDLMQGYLLGRPKAEAPHVLDLSPPRRSTAERQDDVPVPEATG